MQTRSLEYGRDAATLLITDAAHGGRFAQLLGDIDGRPLQPISWAKAIPHLTEHDGTVAVVADAAGVDEEVLEAVVPALADLIRRDGTPTVVHMDVDQIDCVAGAMIDSGALLLCEATVAEQTAALMVVLRAGSPSALHESSPDGERQLRKLNEDIARIADTLARLSHESRRGSETQGLADRMTSFAVAPAMDAAPGIKAREVRDAIRVRRLRDQFFGEGLFEDPAWDMLLDLFAAELESAQVSVSSLCIAAHVAPTTALRWIGKMTDRGLLVRFPDPFDRRRAFMALARPAGAGLVAYAAAVRQAGLRFA